MSNTNEALLKLKGLIFDMPQETQNKVKIIQQQINEKVKAEGVNGIIALVLCTTEIVDSAEREFK